MIRREERDGPNNLEITKLADFGKTGLKVTPLCVGITALGNMPEEHEFSISESEILNQKTPTP